MQEKMAASPRTAARPKGQGLFGSLFAALRGGRAAASSAAAQMNGVALLNGMGWGQFELLVAEGFRLRGYAVSETGGNGARAVDMVLHRGVEQFLVDCKRWRSLAVGAAPLRELQGLMAARGAAGGFVVSSGSFTEDAIRFADGHAIQLIDGSSLRDLLSSRDEKTQPLVRRDAPFLDTTLPPSAWLPGHPPCPLCGARMVERAQPASRVGSPLGGWHGLGCSRAPVCGGERALPAA